MDHHDIIWEKLVPLTAGVVPSATMQSKDGKYVIIGGNGDSVYSRLMGAMGRPNMASSNPLYATNTHRCQRADEIYKVGAMLRSGQVPVSCNDCMGGLH